MRAAPEGGRPAGDDPHDPHYAGSMHIATSLPLALLLWASPPGPVPGEARRAQQTPAAPVTSALVILIDDLGIMDVGAYNPATFYETPAIDALAASGLRFTSGYAASPVCSPTRYSLMTGKHPARGRATDYFSGNREGRFKPAELHDRMEPAEFTLAEALAEAGRATFFAGKWHLGPSEEYWPEAQGFDVNAGGWMRGGPYGGNQYFSPYGNSRLADGPEGEHLPDRLASETIAFLEARAETDEPFFAYLCFYSVHTPLMGPAELVAKYEQKAAGLPEGADFTRENQHWPTLQERSVRVRQNHATYAAMVESTDRAIGRVLARLEQLGLADTTAVFLTSDNGGLSTSEGSPTSNLPFRGGKGWLYEGGIREPFLARVPGRTEPGTTCDVPVQSTDLYPTVLEILELPARPEQHLDGLSFAPLLSGSQPDEQRALFWHYPHYSNQGGFPGAAIRVGRWKLLELFETGDVYLHDLDADPGERRDRQVDEPEIARDLRGKLHEWYTEVDAQFLGPKDGRVPWRPD